MDPYISSTSTITLQHTRDGTKQESIETSDLSHLGIVKENEKEKIEQVKQVNITEKVEPQVQPVVLLVENTTRIMAKTLDLIPIIPKPVHIVPSSSSSYFYLHSQITTIGYTDKRTKEDTDEMNFTTNKDDLLIHWITIVAQELHISFQKINISPTTMMNSTQQKEQQQEEEKQNITKTTTHIEFILLNQDLNNNNNNNNMDDGILEGDISWNTLGKEGYAIHITTNCICIYAYTLEGFFRSFQTFKQLIPPSSSSTTTIHTHYPTIQQQQQSHHHNHTDSYYDSYFIPCGMIIDYPNFVYRGIMIDVARHFFSISTIQSLMDILSLYKINYLHLHLSDDQGWRLTIPSYPNLTLIGGQSEVGGRKRRSKDDTLFFTQEEYIQLVQYAQEKYITIVPEIDMPGHVHALLYSYPQLQCPGEEKTMIVEPFTGTFGGFSSLCLSHHDTWTFVETILEDVIDMTPGPYIHIGADEVFSMNIQDYCTFIQFVGQVIDSYDKIMIGWDDIGECEVTKINGTTTTTTTTNNHPFIIQWWRNWEDGEKKVRKGVDGGHEIIMSPAKMTYMDMKYNEDTILGQSSVGYIEIDKTYNWNPETILPGVKRKDILGVEAPLWTEFIYTPEDIEYMMFPRSIALAEVGWTPLSRRHWDDFRTRLKSHYDRLTSLNVHFYKSPLVFD